MNRSFSRPCRILFVSPNGVGVGHLMRLMAMARRASEQVQPVFLTMSQALPVVREAGFVAEYMPAKGYALTRTGAWHELLRRKVREVINTYRIDIVVFDGVWPFAGLRQAMADHPHVPLVWSRRGMWKETVDHMRLDGAPPADVIVEPGELASSYDRGLTSRYRHQAKQVPPVTYLTRSELLSRESGRTELGLDPTATVALIQLGAGNIQDKAGFEGLIVNHLRKRRVEAVIAKSMITDKSSTVDGARLISIYPLSRYLQAFDFAVAAPGYNTFHEVLLAGLPTAFAPMPTSIDDQAARARWAEDHGLGLHLRSVSDEEVDRVLDILLEPQSRREIRTSVLQIENRDGAAEALKIILKTEKSGQVRTRVKESEEPAWGGSSSPSGDGEGPSRRTAAYSPLGRTRFSALRMYDAPASLRVLRWLPNMVRSALRRLLRRLDRSLAWRREATRRPKKVGLHPGNVLTAEESETAAPIGFLLFAETRYDLEKMLEAIAQEQATRRTFAPLLFTTVDAFDIIRRYQYQAEYLLPPEDLARLEPDTSWSDYRDKRVARVSRTYRLADVVSVTPDTTEDEQRWAELTASLPD